MSDKLSTCWRGECRHSQDAHKWKAEGCLIARCPCPGFLPEFASSSTPQQRTRPGEPVSGAAEAQGWRMWNGYGPNAEGYMMVERFGPDDGSGIRCANGGDMMATREEWEWLAAATQAYASRPASAPAAAMETGIRGDAINHTCYFCAGPLSQNPHPDAGKPDKMLEVGLMYECIPCNRGLVHRYSERAYEQRERAERAEAALAAVEEVLNGIRRAAFDIPPDWPRKPGLMVSHIAGLFYKAITEADSAATPDREQG